MSLHTLLFPFTDSQPSRIDDFLLIKLPSELKKLTGSDSFSKSKLRRLIVAGAVSVNGQQVRNADRIVKKGNTVTVKLDTEKFSFEKKPDDIPFDLSETDILFEDDSIIVINKPAGIPTEATMVQSRDHLHAAVQRYLAKRDGQNADGSDPYVGLHHRLDRETSGVILFTKNRSANPAVHKMFLEHLAVKNYHALTARPQLLPKKTFFVDNEMARISPKSAPAKWGAVKQGGERARTDFHLLEEYRNGLCVLAIPQTGRTHQIRVHLASLNMPLLGDALYGGPVKIGKYQCPRVMLHALSLTFPHPVDGRQVTVTAPIPADFIACKKEL
jgi:23S rRNA pseudouridine1911/1915/1917 synthase